ncbi:MAG: hypothetical protein KGS60_17235, partial [Verrucomicrobia bacterium]|nr:hypothetical protein [Verrucomicrobiota bacterium]
MKRPGGGLCAARFLFLGVGQTGPWAKEGWRAVCWHRFAGRLGETGGWPDFKGIGLVSPLRGEVLQGRANPGPADQLAQVG